MNYQEWEASVPRDISDDALWTVEAYRLALFVAEIGWQDTIKISQTKQTVSLADQLFRSLGSISANLAEGYSRSSGRDQARFYEYSLGSARESRDWYYKARHILGEQITTHRLKLLTQIIRLLLAMIPKQRSKSTRETQTKYFLDDSEKDAAHPGQTHSLLKEIPIP
jgi:four helix bundle protein